jgi:hypothetical protein
MNIAFSAVILFVLLLPPVAFYVSFCYGRFQKGKPQWSSVEVMMACAISALIIHAIGILFVYKSVRLDLLILLLLGQFESTIEKYSNEELRKYLIDFSFYNAAQLIFAIISGRLIRWYLQHSNIHSKMEVLRIYNHWWYLFNAYKAESILLNKIQKSFDIVFIDVLINTNSGTMLYSGCLTDFVCNGETLERLYLSDSVKRDFKTMHKTEAGNLYVNKPGPSQEIKGEMLAIPAQEIVNINIRFIDLSIYANEISNALYVQ